MPPAASAEIPVAALGPIEVARADARIVALLLPTPQRRVPHFRYWPRLCEKTTTPDCDRRSYLFKTAVGAHTARPFNFEAELKNIILVAPRACEFSHNLGPERHIAPPRDLGRYQSIAEVDGQPSIAEDDALDAQQTNMLL